MDRIPFRQPPAFKCGQVQLIAALSLLRQQGSQRELCFQLYNLSAYHLAVGQDGLSRQLLQEAVRNFPHDDSSWHWGLMQAGAYLKILDGDLRSAAKVIGYVGRRIADSGEPRQSKELIMRNDMIRKLQAAMSERRASSLVSADREMVRYRSRRPPETDLRERLRSLANERRRFGYRRLFIMLRREGK